MRRIRAAVAALAVVGLGTFAVASPAAAVDTPHYATGEWLTQDWPNDTPEPAEESAATCETVTLTKTAGNVGTSHENGNLDLSVANGDALKVDYVLSDGATTQNNAIRMFAYHDPGEDTSAGGGVAPSWGSDAADSDNGTLVLDFTADGTIGTFGLTYDASNDSAGTVTFTNLRLVTAEGSEVPVSFCAEPEPEDTTSTTTTTTSGALADTGSSLTTVLAVAAALVVIGAAVVVLARRRRA